MTPSVQPLFLFLSESSAPVVGVDGNLAVCSSMLGQLPLAASLPLLLQSTRPSILPSNLPSVAQGPQDERSPMRLQDS
ncbi:hypothetical protein PsYK624_123170 [Phanerochaete sordida]|uniref:Uncharacterized protein n=1 Tax=Phanerochaete sordida TaxID=48140 RepID=A0A9P3GMF4_9APHY|nr:hypothetical protein PsYK624_123170 [Phanerochaete sordida]